jgi:hypothetical protein
MKDRRRDGIFESRDRDLDLHFALCPATARLRGRCMLVMQCMNKVKALDNGPRGLPDCASNVEIALVMQCWSLNC